MSLAKTLFLFIRSHLLLATVTLLWVPATTANSTRCARGCPCLTSPPTRSFPPIRQGCGTGMSWLRLFPQGQLAHSLSLLALLIAILGLHNAQTTPTDSQNTPHPTGWRLLMAVHFPTGPSTICNKFLNILRWGGGGEHGWDAVILEISAEPQVHFFMLLFA